MSPFPNVSPTRSGGPTRSPSPGASRTPSQNPHPPAPDRFGVQPIIGWRYWYANNAGTLEPVSSVTERRSWPPGHRAEARCDTWDHHVAPVLRCGCGINAYKGRTIAEQIFKLVSEGEEELCGVAKHAVFGRVALWGRVQEYRAGWRAQYGYPQALWAYDAEIARLLYKNYGVETEVFEA